MLSKILDVRIRRSRLRPTMVHVTITRVDNGHGSVKRRYIPLWDAPDLVGGTYAQYDRSRDPDPRH